MATATIRLPSRLSSLLPARLLAALTLALALGLALAAACALGAEDALPAAPLATVTLLLWSDAAPGETGTAKPETDEMGKDNIRRISEVSVPTISLFPAPAATSNGTAVVICPGGGYHILAWDLEGTEVASWLNSCGITAVTSSTGCQSEPTSRPTSRRSRTASARSAWCAPRPRNGRSSPTASASSASPPAGILRR